MALQLNGVPIDPAASYRVTTNDFLANGGDGFTNLTAGTDRTTAPGFDVDALTAYLGVGRSHRARRTASRWSCRRPRNGAAFAAPGPSNGAPARARLGPVRTPIYLEQGGKRTFACSLDWPGWCRSGRSAEAAVESLTAYAERYAVVAAHAGLAFDIAAEPSILETVPGNATTDFGAPDAVPAADARRLTAAQAAREVALVRAAWRVLDEAAAVSPAELRKGPRGGGRDRDKMLDHVVGSEASYARMIGVRHKPPALGDTAAIDALRADICAALERPSDGTPLRPGGWPARYAARRIAWHVLDHAWEMSDRSA